MNLASRMEGLTKAYGIPVLSTEATYRELKGRVPCRIVDLVWVKGREDPVRVYGLLCTSFDPSELLREKGKIAYMYEEAFAYYLNQEWKKAVSVYGELKKIIPEGKYTRIMIKRCEEFQKKRVENWDAQGIL